MTEMTEKIERILALLHRSQRYRGRAIVVAVLVVAAGLAFTLLQPRRWMSETVVVYRETMRSSDVSGLQIGTNNDARFLGPRLREMLLSRAQLEPIISEFKLYPEIVSRRGLVDAVEEMRKHLQFRSREGDTFAISFEANSALLAQQVTARLGRCIVDSAAKHRTAQAEVLSDFLGAESARYTSDLKEKEAALAQFAAEHPSFAARAAAASQGRPEPVPAAMPAPPPAPRSRDAKMAALELRAARVERRLRPATLVPGAVPSSPGGAAVPEDPPELVAARRDLADKLARYTDRHPDVLAARAHLREVEEATARIRAARQASSAGEREPAAQQAAQAPLTEEQREALTAELATIRALMDQRRQALLAMGISVPDPSLTGVALEVEFGRLQREAQQARERLRQLEDREFRARLAASSVEDDRNIQVSILDPAFLPTHPRSRARTITMLMFLLAAGVLGLGAAIGSAIIDDRIYEGRDVPLLLPELQLLGVIPNAARAIKP